jgi:hypothetical protein
LNKDLLKCLCRQGYLNHDGTELDRFPPRSSSPACVHACVRPCRMALQS